MYCIVYARNVFNPLFSSWIEFKLVYFYPIIKLLIIVTCLHFIFVTYFSINCKNQLELCIWLSN